MTTTTAPVMSFTGRYRFLSNFWSATVYLDGIAYPSVENGFQAAKTVRGILRRPLEHCSASDAKRIGRRLPLRDDWEDVKLGVMEHLLRQKFAPGTELARLLNDTGNCQLVEGNTWRDVYWGVCNGQGENHLGRLLMIVRNDNRQRLRE